MKKLISAMLFLLFCITVSGEKLNLEQLIAESVKNSEKVKIQSARFDKSVNERKSVAMNFLPKTKIDIKLLELKYAPEPDPLTLDIAPLMGLMEVPLEVPQHQRKLDVTLVQPLSQLWGIYHGYKARQLTSEIQKMKMELTKNQIEIQVTEYFLTYNMINDVLELLDETDKQLNRYVFTTESFIEKGLTDKRGLLKIKIEKAKVAKEREKYEGLQSIIKTALSYLIERDEKTFEIDAFEPKITEIDKDISYIVDAQKKTRMEFKLLGKSDEIRDHVDKRSYQQFVPQIAFTMGFKKDWDYTVINPEGVFFVGGVLSWGFGVDTAQAFFDYKSVKAESVVTKLKNIKLRKDMALQIRKMFVDIKVLEKTILIDQSQVDCAKENIRIEEEKYKNQMTSETDLLSAVLNLKKAETSKISNKYQHEIILKKIILTSGIDLEPKKN